MLGTKHDFERESYRSLSVAFDSRLIACREHAPSFFGAASGKDFGELLAASDDGARFHFGTVKVTTRQFTVSQATKLR